MSPISHLRIHQKMLTSTKFLLKFFTIFPFFLHNLVQVRYSITGFPLFCSMFLSPMLLKRVVTWEFLLARRINSTASNLIEHASSQHDNRSPLYSLYKNDSFDTYVPPAFHISFDVSQHQISCIHHQISHT